jgi:hypothetical protein
LRLPPLIVAGWGAGAGRIGSGRGAGGAEGLGVAGAEGLCTTGAEGLCTKGADGLGAGEAKDRGACIIGRAAGAALP